MLAYRTNTFKAAPHSAHPDTSMSSTAVQFFQNGTLHSIDLPGARNPRETERLQEYIQNTAFGTTNLMKSMSKDSIDFLRNHYNWSEKIVGSIFHGLSREEVQWLKEQGWTEDRQWFDPELSEHEMNFLCAQSLLKTEPTSPVAAPFQTAAQPVVSHQSHSTNQTTNGVAILEDPAPEGGIVERDTISALPAPCKRTTAESVAMAALERLGIIRDGRPASNGTQKAACSLFLPRATTNSTSAPSPSSAWSMVNFPSRSTSGSPTPLPQLVETSTPDGSNTVAVPAQPRPPRYHIPLIATIRHEKAHGRYCPYRCEYDPDTRTWFIQQRRVQTLAIDSPAALEEVPEVPTVDWERERRRWRFSRGGQSGDPAMD